MTTKHSFLLDENVDVRIGTFLKQAGHDVSFVPKGIRNGEVLALAEEGQCILVTHDTDFLDVFIAHKHLSIAIIVLRIHPPIIGNVVPIIRKFLPDMQITALPVVYELSRDGFRIHWEPSVSQ